MEHYLKQTQYFRGKWCTWTTNAELSKAFAPARMPSQRPRTQGQILPNEWNAPVKQTNMGPLKSHYVVLSALIISLVVVLTGAGANVAMTRDTPALSWISALLRGNLPLTSCLPYLLGKSSHLELLQDSSRGLLHPLHSVAKSIFWVADRRWGATDPIHTRGEGIHRRGAERTQQLRATVLLLLLYNGQFALWQRNGVFYWTKFVMKNVTFHGQFWL